MPPKTRLDRLVTVRERSEESALLDLAHAQNGRDQAALRLAGMRQQARSDARGPGTAQLWVLEEFAHLQALRQVQRAETDLVSALRKEQSARIGYTSAHKNAEVARRAQGKKRVEISAEQDRRERRALDELATLRFNTGK